MGILFIVVVLCCMHLNAMVMQKVPHPVVKTFRQLMFELMPIGIYALIIGILMTGLDIYARRDVLSNVGTICISIIAVYMTFTWSAVEIAVSKVGFFTKIFVGPFMLVVYGFIVILYALLVMSL